VQTKMQLAGQCRGVISLVESRNRPQ